MRANTRRRGQGFYQLAANLRRLQTAQANTEITRQGIETTQQMPEPAPLRSWLAAALVDFAVTGGVFVALLGYYRVAPTLTWLWAVPIFVVQIALSLGLMLILAPLNTMYRDVGQAIPLAIQVWMYATPIMYPASLVPQSVRPYYFLNPMAVIVEGYRSAILRNQAPDWVALAYTLLLAIVALGGGYHLFKRLEKRIADVA